MGRKMGKGKCFLCGGSFSVVVPVNVSLCGDCLRSHNNYGARWVITSRNPLGGFCQLENRMRWNVSEVNTDCCSKCLSELSKGINRKYESEERKRIKKINTIFKI